MKNVLTDKQNHKLEKYTILKNNFEKIKAKYNQDKLDLNRLERQLVSAEAEYNRLNDKHSELTCLVNRYVNYIDELKSKRHSAGMGYSHYDINVYNSAMALFAQHNRELMNAKDDLRVVDAELRETKSALESKKKEIALEINLIGELSDLLNDFKQELTQNFDVPVDEL